MSKPQVILNLKKDKSGAVVIAGAGVGAAALAYESPASAQSTTTSPIDSVSTMITSLGGIAAAVTVVVLGAMGVRMAIKLVNRVGVKG